MLGAFIRWFLYSIWFVLALVGSLYLSIPKDEIRRFVQHHATAKLKTKVSIDKLQLHGITGIELTGVQIVLPVKKPTPPATPSVPGAPGSEKTPGAEVTDESGGTSPTESEGDAAAKAKAAVEFPGLLIADKLRVDVNTLGLLVGQKLKARLEAEVSGGTISDTTLTATEDGFSLHVGEIENVNLGPVKPFRTLMKMDLDVLTRLSGHLELHYGGSLATSRGELELTLSDTVLPYLPLKDPRQPFPIGEAFEVQLGTLELKALLDRSDKLPGVRARAGSPTTLLIEKLSARGEHVELQLDSGQKHTLVFGGPTTGDAELDITFVLSFTDAFFAWKGTGHRPDGEEVADASHSGLEMGLQHGLKAARTVIGQKAYYGFHCVGRLKEMKCLPKAPSRRLTPLSAEPPKPGAGDAKPGDAGDSGEGDEVGVRPSAPNRPSANASDRTTPKPRFGNPNDAARTRPRLVEPTRPSAERLDAARLRGSSGNTGDTLGPGVQGGFVPPPEGDAPVDPAPVEEPSAAEVIPEPVEGAPPVEEAPADGVEGAPVEGGEQVDGVPPAEGEDGADGAQPAEGEEPAPE